ncbi:AMP-binding protein [Candidatus Sumerlaeota bacterium]|nr:AMP-binding protein [Candidatus Sumerlaeota bacterium]
MTSNPPSNVYDVLRQSARAWPRRTALIDEAGEVDYETLFARAEDLRLRLEREGIGPGLGVGVMGRNGRAFVETAFAAAGCGAVVMPMSHRFKPVEIADMLESAPLHAIVRIEPAAKDGASPSPRIEWTGTERTRPFAPSAPDAAFVRFTSGTTGASKGVLLSNASVLERTEAANRGLGLSSDDTVLFVLPMAYHFFVSVVLYLRYGCTVVVCRDQLAETILADAERFGATFLYAAPLHYRMLAADRSPLRFRTLERAISTSIGLPPDVARSFAKRFGIPIGQAYGIIEIGLPLANLDAAAERPDSIGRPLPGYEAALLDERGHPVEEGEIGELAIRGPGMFVGYLSPPRRRDEILRDGWFMTGDLAQRDAQGYVTIRGRCKSMINVGGQKVFPEQVEAVLDRHPCVKQSRVSAHVSASLGEVVHADVVLRPDVKPPTAEDIIEFGRGHLAAFETPQTVAFVKRIEETRSGKIARR